MASTLPLEPGRFGGKTLGKYEVLSRLSTGGMSEIYLAFQRGLAGFQKLVVLKSILPDIRLDEEFVKMFVDEAKITALFNHPHIAQVFELDMDDGVLFLAMEFVPGATLVEVARACRNTQQPIPIGLTLSAVRDSALALHYAHTFTDPLGRKHSVIHRDVAEKNIMLTYEGITKLLDFGIAKSASRQAQTQVGMVKGTSGYMSPEQILGQPLDARTDLFSLGVVLHECLTGMRLFYGPKPEDGMTATLKGEVAAPSKFTKGVSPALDAVCLKALSRKREDRHVNALEFARDLEKVAQSLFWKPEQSGEFIQSLFADRREQTRHLYEQARMQGDNTGQFSLTGLIRSAKARGLRTMQPLLSAVPPPPPPPPSREITQPELAFPIEDKERYTLPVKDLPSDFREPPEAPSEVQESTDEFEDDDEGFTSSFQRVSQGIPRPLRYGLLGAWLLLVWYLFFGFAPDRKPVVPAPVAHNSVEETLKTGTDPGNSELQRTGQFTLITQPRAEVYLGNTRLGRTPLTKVSLPAGKNSLRILDTKNRFLLLEVYVPAGQSVSRRALLKDLPEE
jgi:serine/threonine protein kinase